MMWCIPCLIPGFPAQTDSMVPVSAGEVYRPLMAVEPQSLDALLKSDAFERLLDDDFSVQPHSVRSGCVRGNRAVDRFVSIT